MENTTAISELINLTGKVAIVTGGAKGIGLGIVRRLHEAGAKVVIADQDEAEAQKIAAECNAVKPDSALSCKTDVSQNSDVQQLVAATVEKYGRVDILVNNAGIFPIVTMQEISEDTFKKVLDVNIMGPFLCTKYVSQQMIAQGSGGRIINITSIDALHPSAIGLAHYDASKHGLWGFTKNTALELAPHKIWVNAIAPGVIATPGASAGTKDSSLSLEDFVARIPMGRIGQPDDIGRAALFLASDMASFMTGSQIVVDGGTLLK